MRGRTPVLCVFGFAAAIFLGAVSSCQADRGGQAEPSRAPETATVSVSPAQTTPVPDEPMPVDLTEEERRNIRIFREASRSTVHITSVGLRRQWFSPNLERYPQGSGTGFVWDRSGHIVTNHHVIQGAREFEVTLADNSTHQARVIGRAPDKDLAVLEIGAPGDQLHPLALGTSANLAVGQKVLAVGNPFGLDQTLTVGVVSAVGRELTAPNGRTIRDVIQTDAAINPGNSGGPLLDSGGRLIGVNSQIYSPSGASAGIGFAVPVDTVRRLVPQLIEHGKPRQPGIGVTLLTVSDYDAWRLGIEGLLVRDVVRGGPADRAGIEPVVRITRDRRILGDQIVAANGERVRNLDELLYAFEEAGVGARITLRLLNDGQEREVELVLAELE